MRRASVSMLLCSVVLGAASPEWERAHQLYERTEYRQSLALLARTFSGASRDASAPPVKNTTDVPTLQLIGQNYFMLGEYKVATEAFERAVAIDPKNSVCFHWLGRTYGRRAEIGNPFTAPGYATKARQLFEKSVELDPANQEAVNDLFDYYLEAPGFLGGGLHKAEQLASHIAKLDAAEGFYAQAQIDDKRKQFDDEEAHLRRAAELAPRQVGRWLDLAKYFAKRGRVKESEALFDQAMNMAPDSPKILYERAAAYVQDQRNLREARELLERYMRSPLTPDDPPREYAAALLKKIGS